MGIEKKKIASRRGIRDGDGTMERRGKSILTLFLVRVIVFLILYVVRDCIPRVGEDKI